MNFTDAQLKELRKQNMKCYHADTPCNLTEDNICLTHWSEKYREERLKERNQEEVSI